MCSDSKCDDEPSSTHSRPAQAASFDATWQHASTAAGSQPSAHADGTFTLMGATDSGADGIEANGTRTQVAPPSGLQQKALRELQRRLGLLPAAQARKLLGKWQGDATVADSSVPHTQRFTQPTHQDDEPWQRSRGKQKAQVTNPDQKNVTEAGRVVVGDAMGGMIKPRAHDGANHAHAWVDMRTRDACISVMGSHNGAETLQSFRDFCMQRKVAVQLDGEQLCQRPVVKTDDWQGHKGIFEKTLKKLGVAITHASACHHNANDSACVERSHAEMAARMRANLLIGAPNFTLAKLDPCTCWSAAIKLACLRFRLTPRAFLDGDCTLERAWGRQLSEMDVLRLIPTRFGGRGHFELQRGRRPGRGCVQMADRRVPALHLCTDHHGRHCRWDLERGKEVRGVDIHWEHIPHIQDQPHHKLLQVQT